MLKQHIERRRKIEEAEQLYREKLKVIKEEKYASIQHLLDEEKELMTELKEIYREDIIRSHDCDCCNPKFPDEYHLDDEGMLHVRYDADHTNDIMDFEVLFTDLLKEKEQRS